MPSDGVDAALIQDFLTESRELIEALDADLVRLEADPSSKSLLDGIFRSLHTIKGAASFLNMPAVTGFSHAAEDALNRLRKGEIAVDAAVVDALLRSVDVLRGMFDELSRGSEPTPGPDDLIDQLHAISEATSSVAAAATAAATPTASASPEQSARTLRLRPDKADLLPGLGTELEGFARLLDAAADTAARGNAVASSATLNEAIAGLKPTADYFEFPAILAMLGWLDAADTASRPQALAHAAAQARAMERDLAANLEPLWSDTPGAAPAPAPAPAAAAPRPAAPQDAPERAASSSAPAAPAPTAPRSAAPQKSAKDAEPRADSAGETTVRVEIERLEALLNLAGEMVLTKNQILGVTKQLRTQNIEHDVMESVTGAIGSLDRLTSELQVAVMRMRLQPLSKLFSRYPRVVRDLARATEKKIDIDIVGGETEVDKSVLEQLADPMVHILRNSADHGIELPDVRAAAGKNPTGLIRVTAAHRGGHVSVLIEDDGKGIDPDIVSRKAIEKGIVSPEQVAQMSDREKVELVFAPGFSTAEKVSNLSGRGVGMDVVRTNINKLGGTVSITSIKGKGTTIEVMIPLTVAIMSAMVVGIGPQQYAVPVASIVEIVRLQDAALHSVAGKPVLRLRESVLPLVDMAARLGENAAQASHRFAVVIEVGQQRAGLMVDDLVGQQEVVIKPLDDAYASGGPFSGATIREDGDVSLILDTAALVRAENADARAA
ncbi:MAG: chemotaxis protein CheA [Planctomycetota bacterium]|nr:chemotaxis protein CheA [Planctomycetota bacterium]